MSKYPEYMEVAYLTTASSEIEASMLQELLQSNQIQSVKKYREAGGYLTVYMGDTSFGVDIYVDEEKLSLAKEITPSGLLETSKEELNLNTKESKKSNGSKTFFIILCIICVIFIRIIF